MQSDLPHILTSINNCENLSIKYVQSKSAIKHRFLNSREFKISCFQTLCLLQQRGFLQETRFPFFHDLFNRRSSNRFKSFSAKRDQHGASFQSSPKINSMLITRSFAYNKSLHYPTNEVFLISKILLFFSTT